MDIMGHVSSDGEEVAGLTLMLLWFNLPGGVRVYEVKLEV